MKKKILLLGGSAAQLIAIKKAKDLGYYTIVCDYLPDNPGQFIADKFYLESTTNKEAILDIALKERIDGIVAYSSDPAAPTAAFIANEMHLPGLDYNLVRQFCEKQLFRNYLKNHNFNVPESLQINLGASNQNFDFSKLRLPIIIKPTDSSGSKGITVVNKLEDINDALNYASQYSRNKIIIAEEFIERDHANVIEAEIFVIDGIVKSWGLFDSIRDFDSNPLLPAGYSYPLSLPEQRIQIVKNEVSRLISTLGKPSGAFNIEMIIDKDNRLFFLDAGPRNGGNMLPEWISMISGKDTIGATIETAMGKPYSVNVDLDGKSGGFWGMGVLHSAKAGFFKGIEYSPVAKSSLKREVLHYKEGDKVRRFERCDDLVGLNFLKFTSKIEMEEVMGALNKSMRVVLK